MTENSNRMETLGWVGTYSANVAKKVMGMRISPAYQYPKFSCKDFNSDVDIILHRPEMNNLIHIQDYLEIIYAKKGRTNLQIGKESISIGPDSFMLIGSYLPHQDAAESGSEIYHILMRSDIIMKNFINLMNEAPMLSNFFTSFILNPAGKHYLLYHTEPDSEIQQCFNSILETFASKASQYVPILKCQIALLLLYISRQYQQTPDLTNISEGNDTVSEMLKYIYANYATATLKSVAQNFNYNPDYVSRLLKRTCGMGFKQLLTRHRMEQAAVLLAHTCLSVDEISQCIGYASPVNFQSAFRKKYGCTPGTYRAKSKSRLA